MKQPLLKKDIIPACAHCSRGRISPDEKNVLCVRRGVMSLTSSCPKFLYDPLKRQPARQLKLPQYEAEDFEL